MDTDRCHPGLDQVMQTIDAENGAGAFVCGTIAQLSAVVCDSYLQLIHYLYFK